MMQKKLSEKRLKEKVRGWFERYVIIYLCFVENTDDFFKGGRGSILEAYLMDKILCQMNIKTKR